MIVVVRVESLVIVDLLYLYLSSIYDLSALLLLILLTGDDVDVGIVDGDWYCRRRHLSYVLYHVSSRYRDVARPSCLVVDHRFCRW